MDIHTSHSSPTWLSPDDPLLTPWQVGNHTLPGIWRVMMPSALTKLRFPDERRATCQYCPKASYEGYRPDYRCCTYHPRVSNFMLGLAYETAPGRLAVEELLQRGMLLPEGLLSSPRQWLDFIDDEQQDMFGKSQQILCPMLDSVNLSCRIHNFRNSVCSTYFCYNDHGTAGEIFWTRLQTLAAQLEIRLAQWALREIGFDFDAYMQVMDELAQRLPELSTEQGWAKAALAQLWGEWFGKEKELLRSCAQVIATHREELWSIARRQTIREADCFDEALAAAIPVSIHDGEADDEETKDDENDDHEDSYEEERNPDLQLMWQDCLSAHDLLWNCPEGLFTLSPHVQFVTNHQRSAEERYHQDKYYFLEHYFQDADHTVVCRLPLSWQEKQLLELFRDKPRAMPPDSVFLLEMLKYKVLRIAALKRSSP